MTSVSENLIFGVTLQHFGAASLPVTKTSSPSGPAAAASRIADLHRRGDRLSTSTAGPAAGKGARAPPW